MTESDDRKKLVEEVATIDAQMAALAERKRKYLSKLPHTSSGGEGTDTLDSFAEVVAEGIVYLGERGLLPLKDEPISALPEKLIKVKFSNGKAPKRALNKS